MIWREKLKEVHILIMLGAIRKMANAWMVGNEEVTPIFGVCGTHWGAQPGHSLLQIAESND